MVKQWTATLVTVLGMTGATCAVAQDYPNRAVRIIVPLATGGTADILARMVSNDLAGKLGRAVLVENRTGGGGHIGSEFVAKSPADGYTLLSAGIPQAIGMSLYKDLQYDMARDLVAITQGITAPSVIVVHPSLPVKSMKDLIALAKAQPGKLNFGANTGSPNHLAIELLNVSNNLKIVHVPYKGAGPVVIDVMAGHIELASLGLPPALPMVQAGRLRAIAQTGLQRSAHLPDLPTVAESGVPGYDVTSWYGFFAPARTPAAVVSRLNTDIVAVLRMPEVNKRLVGVGADVVPTTADEFGRIVRDEIQKWAKVVKASGAKAE